LRLTTDAPLSYIAHETPFALTHPVTLVLGVDESLDAAVDTISREFLERTRDHWLVWVRGLGVPLGDAHRIANRPIPAIHAGTQDPPWLLATDHG